MARRARRPVQGLRAARHRAGLLIAAAIGRGLALRRRRQRQEERLSAPPAETAEVHRPRQKQVRLVQSSVGAAKPIGRWHAGLLLKGHC